MSLLGFHLRHKLFPDESYNNTMVDPGYGQLVDANFLAAKGTWPKSEASNRLFHTWKNEVFDELVKDIKLAANEGPGHISAEDLLFFMYDLAGNGTDDLARTVEELKRQTLLDGQEHSVRLPMSRYKRGVTFVSFPRPTSATQLQMLERKLGAISLAHKYRSQADEWMILASFADSPVRFDIFGYIKDPWQKDPEMNRWVEKQFGPGIPVRPDGKRPPGTRVAPAAAGGNSKGVTAHEIPTPGSLPHRPSRCWRPR